MPACAGSTRLEYLVPAPVVGVRTVQQQTLIRWGNIGEERPDTLLGFEATGPLSLRPDRGKPGIVLLGEGVVVVAPRWWWGVVFDLWIVVASI